MCYLCDNKANLHKEWNFCPICAKQIKDGKVFIPSAKPTCTPLYRIRSGRGGKLIFERMN